MRKVFLAAALLVTGFSLSGCWHDRYGHGGPGHDSDHHHHGDDHH
jgi:predicted small lipoprotein YifL